MEVNSHPVVILVNLGIQRVHYSYKFQSTENTEEWKSILRNQVPKGKKERNEQKLSLH